MMKKNLVVPCLLLCMAAGTAFAEEAQQEWKCYVELKSGEKHIAHYVVQAKKGKVVEQRLASLPVFAADGVTRLKVKKQLECQPEDRPFIDPAAQLMEKDIPR